MSVEYKRVNWKNNITLVNETNLNNMDLGIEQVVEQSNDNQERLSIIEESLSDIDNRLSILEVVSEDHSERLNLLETSVSDMNLRLTYIEENAFSNDLSNLPTVEEFTDNSYLYVDNGGIPSKTTPDNIGNVVVEDDEGNVNRNKIKFKELNQKGEN